MFILTHVSQLTKHCRQWGILCIRPCCLLTGLVQEPVLELGESAE